MKEGVKKKGGGREIKYFLIKLDDVKEEKLEL